LILRYPEKSRFWTYFLADLEKMHSTFHDHFILVAMYLFVYLFVFCLLNFSHVITLQEKLRIEYEEMKYSGEAKLSRYNSN